MIQLPEAPIPPRHLPFVGHNSPQPASQPSLTLPTQFYSVSSHSLIPPEKPGDAPVQRPTWQRAGLGHLTLGVGLATLLFIARSRAFSRTRDSLSSHFHHLVARSRYVIAATLFFFNS